MAARKSYRISRLLAGVVACGLLTWALFRSVGPIGIVTSAPVWGLFFALPILDGASAFGRFVRYLSWRDVDGRYYEHRGIWIDVVEDAQRERFVRLEHVRQILPDLASTPSLRRRYADRTLTREDLAYLRDDALLDYLGERTSPDAVKLKIWLEKTVALPGRNARARR